MSDSLWLLAEVVIWISILSPICMFVMPMIVFSCVKMCVIGFYKGMAMVEKEIADGSKGS